MIPIALDPAHVRIAVAGSGPRLRRRLALLEEGGARPAVFAPDGDAVEGALRRLPTPDELAGFHVLFLVDVPAAEAETLAAAARARGLLVNAEDVLKLCDFHSPAVVRRGALVISVATGGANPGLAARLRRYLEALFPPVWAERMEEARRARDAWRAQGLDGPAVMARTDALISERKWLS